MRPATADRGMSAGLLILEHREVFGERFKCQRLAVKLARISLSRVWIISLTAARRFGLHVALLATTTLPSIVCTPSVMSAKRYPSELGHYSFDVDLSGRRGLDLNLACALLDFVCCGE